VGHETGDRFVMHGDSLDIAGALMQRIDEADVAVAAQSEYVRHFFAYQVVDYQLTTIESVFYGHCEAFSVSARNGSRRRAFPAGSPSRAAQSRYVATFGGGAFPTFRFRAPSHWRACTSSCTGTTPQSRESASHTPYRALCDSLECIPRGTNRS